MIGLYGRLKRQLAGDLRLCHGEDPEKENKWSLSLFSAIFCWHDPSSLLLNWDSPENILKVIIVKIGSITGGLWHTIVFSAA
jgi:hypothetical protein